MIEEDTMAVKIAESPEEAFWMQIKKSSEKEIDALKKGLMFNEAVIEMAERKLNGLTKTTSN